MNCQDTWTWKDAFFYQETFGLKLNGKFNPRVDSFRDLKLRKGRRDENRGEEGLHEYGIHVSPLDTGRGVRTYTCNQCPELVFDLLDGPLSAKEHVATHHAHLNSN